ncbi:ankyrin repeat-containing domain, PGG domain protein [Tanacetum coccineum]
MSEAITPVDKITNNGNTALHVAVGSSSKNNKFLEELLEMTPAENTLVDVQNSDGSTPLHVAAIVGNTEAAKILKEENREVFSGRSGDELLVLAISSKNWKFANDLLYCYETIHSEAVLMAMSQNYPPRYKFWDGLEDYLEYEDDELEKAWKERFHSSTWSRHTCAAKLWTLFFLGT